MKLEDLKDSHTHCLEPGKGTPKERDGGEKGFCVFNVI
jgi:hypothetical protein